MVARLTCSEQWRLPVHLAIVKIRETIGWTAKRMAIEMGYPFPRWSAAERGRIDFTLRQLERVREATGYDPYVIAYFSSRDASMLPGPIKRLHGELKAEWENQLNLARRNRRLLPIAL